MEKTGSDRLTDALVRHGLLSRKELEKVLKTQRGARSILEALAADTRISQEALIGIVAAELDITPVNIARWKIPRIFVSLIPRKLAEAHKVIPLSRIGDVLTIAMADPMNVFALDDLKRETGLVITSVLASPKDIGDAIENLYGEDTSELLKGIVKNMESSDLLLVESQAPGEWADTSELIRLTQEQPIVRVTNSLFMEGVRRRASDIFVEPQERSLIIRYRVDGLLQDGPHPPRAMHPGIVSRIKIMSNLDIAEHRLPQDGRLKLQIQNRIVDFRVSTVPSYFGEKMCVRILDPKQAKLDVRELGFDDASREKLLEAASRPHGMMLICGPTGSGKTTTLYAVLNDLNKIEKNLVTIEDPVEYHMDGINQVNTRPEVHLTFASALRAILRQDPDVVLVGEVRDSETADIAVKAALTGHLVLTTLHTNTAVGSITRLVNMGVEPFLITASVILVASQRLVRKICKRCKKEFAPSGELKKTLGLDEKVRLMFYRGEGCEQCRMTGYLGRVSVIEALPLSSGIKELILQRAPEEKIKRLARDEGMITLRENTLAKAREGVISVDEVLRVTAKD